MNATASPARSDTAGVPLLLLPGTLCDERLFAPLLARLPGRPTAIGSLDGGDTVAPVVAHILTTAPPRFALLGFSLGGGIALELALAAPDRVVGLALIGANARGVDVAQQAARRLAAIEGAADPAAQVRTRLWPEYVAAGRVADVGLRDAVAAMAAELGGEALVRHTALALSRFDARARIGGITCPALVMAGAEDVVCPPTLQEELAALLPDVILALVADAGHFALLERPDACAVHVARWLARVDRSRPSPRRSNASPC